MRLPTRTPARLALLLCSAVAFATCSEPPTGPGRTPAVESRTAKIALAPVFTAKAQRAAAFLRQAGVSVRSVRVVIHRPGTTEVLLDRIIQVEEGQASVTIELDVEVRAGGEELTADIQFRDANGTVLYEGRRTVIARPGENAPHEIPQAEIDFVGPGAGATALALTPADTAISTLTTLDLVATATDAAGASLPNPILAWSVSDPALASVTAAGRLIPAGPRGTVRVRIENPLGLSAEASVRLVPPAARIVVVAGDGQSAPVGTTLPQPFTVQVQAADGMPAAGEPVTFVAISEGGSVATTAAVTDAQGRASTTISLGQRAGVYQFRAISGSVGAATIEATALAAAAAKLELSSGDGQSGAVGTALAAPLAVRVRDSFGNPVAGAAVSWQRNAGTGTLGAATSATDADGIARVAYTLGPRPGADTVTASLQALPGALVEFTVSARAGAPSRIGAVSGNAQSAAPGASLAAPLVVSVTDDFGNPVAGHPVTWQVTTGNAALGLISTPTGAGGLAGNTITLGTPSALPATVTVVASIGSAAATFAATIAAATGAKLALAQEPAAIARSGMPLGVQPAVQVADAGGAAVRQAGVPVTVTAHSAAREPLPVGSAAPTVATEATGLTLAGTTTVVTGADGIARFTDLAIQGAAGPVVLHFTAPGLAAATSRVIELGSGAAVAVAMFPSIPTSPIPVVTGQPITQPFWLETHDAWGNRAPESPVRVVVRGGSTTGEIVKDTTVTTNAIGEFGVDHLPLITVSGLYYVAVSVEPMAEPLVFAVKAAGAPEKLVLTRQPGASALSGALLSPQPIVQVADAFGAPVSLAGVQVQVSAPPAYTIGGTTIAGTGADGAVHFSNLSISGPPGEVALTFTSIPAFAAVTSSPVTLTVPAGSLAGVQHVTPEVTELPLGAGTLSGLQVRAVDEWSNPVAGAPVTLTLLTGSGTFESGTTVTVSTDAAGIATIPTWTLPANTPGMFTMVVQAGTPEAPVGTAIAVKANVVVNTFALSVNTDAPAAGKPVTVTAQLLNADGTPKALAGQPVPFWSNYGGTPFTPQLATTDANGRATTTYVTRGVVGTEHVLTLSAVGVQAPVTVVEQNGGAPAVLTKIGGDVGAWYAGAYVAPGPEVKVTDASGTPVQGVAVTFTVLAGGGNLGNTATSQTALTDARGHALPNPLWQLGPDVGVNTIEATLGAAAIPPVVFSITTSSGPYVVPSGATLIRISTNPTQIVGRSVIVYNGDGSPRANEVVKFLLPGAGENGAFEDGSHEATATTGPDGRATMPKAWVPPAAAPQHYTMEVRAGEPQVGATITFVAARSQWTYAITTVPEIPAPASAVTVKAQLMDGFGAPVHEVGRSVSWSSTTQGVSFSPAQSQTSTSGEAMTAFVTLPGDGTIHEIRAADNFNINGVTHVANATAESPVLSIVQGDAQGDTIDAILPVPLVVELKRGSAPLAGQQVHWESLREHVEAPYNAWIVDSSSVEYPQTPFFADTTDASGRATVRVQLGSMATDGDTLGRIRATAYVDDQEVSQVFTFVVRPGRPVEVWIEDYIDGTQKAGVTFTESAKVAAYDAAFNRVRQAGLAIAATMLNRADVPNDGGAAASARKTRPQPGRRRTVRELAGRAAPELFSTTPLDTLFGPTTVVTDAEGFATFDGWKIHGRSGTYEFRFTADGSEWDDWMYVYVDPGHAAKLKVAPSTPTPVAGEVISVFTRVADAWDNEIWDDARTGVVTWSGTPAAATHFDSINGGYTTTSQMQNGSAYVHLWSGPAGTAHVIEASIGGLSGVSAPIHVLASVTEKAPSGGAAATPVPTPAARPGGDRRRTGPPR